MSRHDSYDGVAKILHWTVAIAVLAAIPMGLAMLRVGSGPLQNQLFDLHRSFGALILGLMIIRVLWRLFHRPPPLDAKMPALQVYAATAVHLLLYVLLIDPDLGSALSRPANRYFAV